MTLKKERTNSARTEEHRARILDAAAQCFMENGYENTTIEDIAQKINSTKGLIYYSFKSKADLFFGVYEASIDRAYPQLSELRAAGGSGLAVLRQICIRHLELLMTALAYHVVTRLGVEMHSSRAMNQEQLSRLKGLIQLRDRYELLFLETIKDGIADGSISVANPSLAARTLLGALNSVSMWYRPREGELPDHRTDIAISVTDVILNGMTAK